MPSTAASRPWFPSALLVASAAVRDVGLTTCLLVLPAAPAPSDNVETTIATTAVAFGMAAALLLVLGTVLAFQSAGRDEPRLVNWYTIGLFALTALGLGQLSVWGWPWSLGPGERMDAVRVFNLVQALIAAHAGSAFIAAVLRTFGSRLAHAWTAGVSVSLVISCSLATLAGIGWLMSLVTFPPLILCFPFGAGLGVAWLVSVRRQESCATLDEAVQRAG
jgi:hypothetical protein